MSGAVYRCKLYGPEGGELFESMNHQLAYNCYSLDVLCLLVTECVLQHVDVRFL